MQVQITCLSVHAPSLELFYIEPYCRRHLCLLLGFWLQSGNEASSVLQYTEVTPLAACRRTSANMELTGSTQALTLSRSIVVDLPLLSSPTTRTLTCGQQMDAWAVIHLNCMKWLHEHLHLLPSQAQDF